MFIANRKYVYIYNLKQKIGSSGMVLGSKLFWNRKLTKDFHRICHAAGGEV